MVSSVKRLFYVIAASLLCMPLSLFAKAADVNTMLYDNLFDATEFREVQEAIWGTDVLYENGILSEAQTRSNGENEFDNSYKLHFLEGNLVSVLNNGGSISTLISDDYVWIVSTANNNAIRVDDVNGKWEVLGYSTPSSKNSTTDLIQMDTLITNLSTFSTDQNAVTELICFEAPMYHTNFVYMNTPDGEVLIPYGSRPDLTGLENGKVYTTQEVSDILADSFSGFYPADANGGPASQSGFYPTDTNGESASQTGMISPSVLIATVILLLTGGCVLFLIRRRVIR